MGILTLETLKNGDFADVSPLNKNFELLKEAINSISSSIYDVLNLSKVIGNLYELTTISKSNIVSAINELVIPAGIIFPFGGGTIPSGFLPARGANNVSRTEYSRLFSVYGTTFGEGDGETTFGLPDCRGVVLRGLDEGRGLDINRTLGSYQEDAMQKIYGRMNSVNRSPIDGVFQADYDAFTTDTYKNSVHHFSCSFDNSRVVRTANENRMKNIAVNFIIKY